MMLAPTDVDVERAVDATEGVAINVVDGQRSSVSGSSTGDAQHLPLPKRERRSRRSSVEVATERDILESSEELLFLEVRPPVFAAIWIGMICIHVFCGMILALQTQLYMYMTNPYMSYYVHLIKPNIVSKYRAAAGVFGALSALHWNVVLRLCYYSIKQRKFAFFPAGHYDPPRRPERTPHTKPGPSTCWTRFKARMHSVSVACFSRRGVLGVESRFFYVYFYLREGIELTSQIYQAYRASLLVARPWVNNLSVAVIIVNCFSTPIIQFYYKKQPEMRRIYLLAIDAILDFVVAIVVPLSIFEPYARAFDLETHTFPRDKLYDHKWFVNAVLENQEVFVISTLDLCFKIIPHLSIRGCLKKVRALVRKDTSVTSVVVDPTDRANSWSKKVVSASALSASERSQRFQAKIDRFHERQRLAKAQAVAGARAAAEATTDDDAVASAKRGALAAANALVRAKEALSRLIHKYAGKLLRALFLVVGCAIILFHGLAFRTSYYGDKHGCWQIMRPWFATKLACSVYEVDCSRLHSGRGALGNASEVEAVLRKLQPSSVAALLFTHCPGLEVPPIIREYNHLLSIDIYNSTLLAWPAEAALTHATNPLTVSLSFVRVHFSGGALPAGVTSDDFPDGLFDVEISTTNLADLPSDLDTKWNRMTKLFVENSALTHFPATLTRLRAEKLSLEGNAIAALPDELFLDEVDQRYMVLALSKNPLAALPAAGGAQAAITYLHVHNTNVTVFPDWVYDKLAAGDVTQIYAHDTPFCASKSAEDVAALHGVGAAITCLSTADADPLDDADGLYPLAFVDERLGFQ